MSSFLFLFIFLFITLKVIVIIFVIIIFIINHHQNVKWDTTTATTNCDTFYECFSSFSWFAFMKSVFIITL